MTPEQQATWDAWLATMRDGWRFDAAPPSGAIESLVLAVDAELRPLRAALAASQAREATFRQALEAIKGALTPVGEPWYDPTLRSVQRMAENALADPSPTADALGRVVRASVAAVQAEWEPDRATLDQARIAQRAAVDGLLAETSLFSEAISDGH